MKQADLKDLRKLADSRREERSHDRKVLDFDWAGSVITALVSGHGHRYNVRIKLGEGRTYKCSCPDHAKRGRFGPCKHTLLVSRHALANGSATSKKPDTDQA